MKNALISFSVLTFVLILFHGCERKVDAPLQIALSKGSPDSSYANYYNWIYSYDSTVMVRDMYALPLDSALKLFKKCSGLVLTGGTDINPAYYGKAYDTVRCWPVDDHRDKLELALIDSALAWGMPILGICRGHQVLNVALGGSLVVDLPSDFGTSVNHQCEDYLSCFHNVSVDSGSKLYRISGTINGVVNSNHHQAVNEMASPLKPVAYSPDGLIEAEEWKDPAGKSFLLGVQWHPERLGNDNPLSGKVGVRFIEECRKFAHK